MIEYYIPAGFGEAEFTEKRSRFIGRVWTVETEAAAIEHIKAMREQHWDASHNVYCYCLREGNIMRYSDDGEPQGTAGMPTLNVFRGEEITNVCCVVTRYFGGTLLGTGGLVRAYSQAAKMALESAGISVVRRWKQVVLSCAYGQFERIRNMVSDLGGILEDTDYGADVVMTAIFPEDRVAAFCDKLVDMTAGTVTAEIVDELFKAVKIK